VGKVSSSRQHDSGALLRQVLGSIQKLALIHAGDRVGAAVSGGADSVALLLLLLELRKKLGVVLSVVHFNHKLRGRASEADEKFVARLAAKLELEFHTAFLHVAKKAKTERANLEDAARRARYDYFRSLVESGKVTGIAVAHTADDQAETVLAHLMRGTGITGLGGIHPVVGPVFRPLLGVRRHELREFLRARKQNWREDLTNRDTKKMRARIRKKLLPLIEKQFQPAIVNHLATLAHLAREDELFFDALVGERAAALVQRSAEGARIGIRDLLEPLKKEEAPVPSKRLVRWIVEEMKPREGQVSASHVEAVLKLARGAESGSALSLPGGLEVRRERSALLFHAQQDARNARAGAGAREFEYNIDIRSGEAEVRLSELRCVFRLRVIDWPSKRVETIKDGAVLDRYRLRFPLVLRNWRPGDHMRPLGHRSAHKLKRLLNEKRISRWERDGWPVLTSGGVLAWARGFPVAAEFAVDERTRAGMVIAEESW
jgi:tRNA(Ile)-lysidine synthase